MGVRDVFTAIIRADAKGAVKELKDLGGAADGLADKVGKRFTSISDAVGSSIGGIIQRSPLAQKALQKTGIDAEAAAGALGTALPTAAAAGAAGLAAFGAIAVKSTMDLDAGILALQRATSATAEEASALVAIGDDFGLGAEAIAGSLGKLAKNADSKVLQEFGVELARNEDGTVNLYNSLVNLADVFGEIDDPTERARLANAAFGKSWQQLLPILEQGRKGLANAYNEIGDGQIRTQEQIDASEQLRLTFDALSDAAGGLSLTVGTFLVPIVQELSEKVLAAKDGLDTLFDVLDNDLLDMLGLSTESLATKFRFLQNSVGFVTDKVNDLRGVTEEADEATEAYGGTVFDLTDAFKAAEKATRTATKATTDQQRADADAAKAAADHARAVDDLRRATDERARAAFDAVFAADRLQRAESQVAEAVDRLNAAEAEAAEAQPGNLAAKRASERANYELRDSIAAVARASVEQAERLSGGAITAQQAKDVQVKALQDLALKFDSLAPVINAYIAELQKIPTDITTNLLLRGGGQINVSAPNLGGVLPIAVAPPVQTPNLGGILPIASQGVTIIMPPGSDGEDVVAAQTRWARRNGLQF